MDGGKRILVVDQDDADRLLTAYILKHEFPALTVDVVENAAQLAESLTKGGLCAVVTGHRLGWSDGPGVVGAVKRVDPACSVVLFAEPGADEAVSEALELGLDGYVVRTQAGFLRLAKVLGRLLPDEARAAETADPPNEPAGESDEDRLRESNRELERFAYVVSHDLQEPLNLTRHYAEMLSERCSGQLDDEGAGYLAKLLRSTGRLQTMIDDILRYSRVQTKGGDLVLADFGAAAKEATMNLAHAIDEAGAEVSVGELPPAPADERQIVQLFQNLISNAIKFRGADTPSIAVKGHCDEASCVYSVSDNGIGIAPEHQERIFEMFQRLHTEAEFPGTGIGLAICKKIVDRHGGRIWVESRLGEGTTFWFSLPRIRGDRT